MFSLGSFSSIMPFLILAITYLAGLTTYSLNFAQKKSEEKKITKKTILVVSENEECALSANTISWVYAAKTFFPENKHTSNSFVVCINASKSRIKNSPPYAHKNFERSLYMRPPPSLSIALG